MWKYGSVSQHYFIFQSMFKFKAIKKHFMSCFLEKSSPCMLMVPLLLQIYFRSRLSCDFSKLAPQV